MEIYRVETRRNYVQINQLNDMKLARLAPKDTFEPGVARIFV